MKIDPYYQRQKCRPKIGVSKFYADICGVSLDRGRQMRVGPLKMEIFAQRIAISRIRCILETKLLHDVKVKR